MQVNRRKFLPANSTEWRFNAPAEFRLITFKSEGPILFDVPPGEYVGIEVVTFMGYPQHLINEALMEVEVEWKAMAGIPHMGKNFGFHKVSDQSDPRGYKVLPFERGAFLATTITSDANRDKFEEYRKKVDPDDVFYGAQAKFFVDRNYTQGVGPVGVGESGSHSGADNVVSASEDELLVIV